MRWEHAKSNRETRAARKCSPTHGMRSMGFSTRPSRRLQRNLLQNPLEQQIPLMPPVVPEAVFVQVSLQILRAHVVIDSADPAFHSAPKAFDSVGVHVARDIHALAVTDAPMGVAEILQAVVGHKIIG